MELNHNTLVHGCQSWPIITKEIRNKIQIFQRSVERSMLGIKIKEKATTVDIYKNTQTIDAAKMAFRLK